METVSAVRLHGHGEAVVLLVLEQPKSQVHVPLVAQMHLSVRGLAADTSSPLTQTILIQVTLIMMGHQSLREISQ